MATLAEALSIALDLHQAGRLDEAETLYRRILTAAPGQPDALHLSGVLAGQRGRTDQAIAWIQKAIALTPSAADCRINLADLLRRSGRLAQAAALYRQALTLRPDRDDALARNRPGPNLNIALANREGEAEFLDILDGPAMMGGLSETFDPGQRAFVDTLIHDMRLITVPVRRLGAVLADHGITHVQYCSIDTEGAERSIIESIDFSRITIDVFSLENPQEDPGLRALMDGLGYDRVCRFFGGDEVYARRGLHRHPSSSASNAG